SDRAKGWVSILELPHGDIPADDSDGEVGRIPALQGHAGFGSKLESGDKRFALNNALKPSPLPLVQGSVPHSGLRLQLRHTLLLHGESRQIGGPQVGTVAAVADVELEDAEGAEVELREGRVVDEVEEAGGDDEGEDEDEDDDAAGAAAYAAAAAALRLRPKGRRKGRFSQRRRFGVGVSYVSPEGLRLDGRRPMEMRQIRAEIGAVSKADGSAIFEMGNTKVIAAVYGPREVQNRSQQISTHALVRCEYSMANFSTGDRMRKSKGDRRSTEISLVIRQTMEACILTHLLPRSQIDIYVQVLQADGGTRSACINAATLALADAGIPMRDLVTSCSAGYLNSTPLLDLNYVEDSAGGPDVTLGILPKLDKVTLLQMDSKLPIDILDNVMQLAIEGCKAIANYIREILLENTKQLEYRRGV
ncbi:Exosome complex component RRP41-like protein, partial [Mucuna pruriens]